MTRPIRARRIFGGRSKVKHWWQENWWFVLLGLYVLVLWISIKISNRRGR